VQLQTIRSAAPNSSVTKTVTPHKNLNEVGTKWTNTLLAPIASRNPALLDTQDKPLHVLSGTRTLAPQPMVKRTTQNAIGVQSSFGQLTRKLKASPEQSAYGQAIEEREAPLYQAGLQLSYQRRLADWLCLEGGLTYLQLLSRYNFEEEKRISGSFPSDSASYFNYPDGSTVYFPGQLPQTVIIEREVQQYNQLHYLGFTIGAKLEHRLASIPLFLRGQYAYYPWQWAEGRSLTPTLQLRDYSDTALRQTMSENLSTLDLQFGSSLFINERLALEGGLHYSRTLSNLSTIDGVELQYAAWGAFLGLSWAW
jgi:hypothetical protein